MSNKSIAAKKKSVPNSRIDKSWRFAKKMAKSVMEKSFGSSRSPSPSNPHASYYHQINSKIKEYSRKANKEDKYINLKQNKDGISR